MLQVASWAHCAGAARFKCCAQLGPAAGVRGCPTAGASLPACIVAIADAAGVWRLLGRRTSGGGLGGLLAARCGLAGKMMPKLGGQNAA